MKIKRLGSGPWAEVVVLGDMLRVEGYDLDVAAWQQDTATVVDVGADASGEIVEDSESAVQHVASLKIPPRKYDEVPQVDQQGNPVLDEQGNQAYVKSARAFDIDACTLTLWPWIKQGEEETT